jgi:hypothetical protein
MNQTEFAVSRFENRNGVISWRVSGWLAGVRIRKNLPTREEAAAEKAALEIKAIQLASGVRSATTFLSDLAILDISINLQKIFNLKISFSPHDLLNHFPKRADHHPIEGARVFASGSFG